MGRNREFFQRASERRQQGLPRGCIFRFCDNRVGNGRKIQAIRRRGMSCVGVWIRCHIKLLILFQEFQKLDNHPNCSDFIADFLQFIKERLLRMDPNKRAHCEEIVCKFTEFHQWCVDDEEYSLKRVSRPPRRTSTSLSELTAEKLKLSQAQNDAIRKNRLPEHTGPVENGRQSSAANTQTLAKERIANIQDESNTSEESQSESKGKAPEKLSTVPEDSPLVAKNFTTTAISEETQNSRPQSPSKKVHFGTKISQPQDLRQSELEYNLSKVSNQFPADPRRNSQLSDISNQEYYFQRNPYAFFGTGQHSTRMFSSPSGSPAPDYQAKRNISSVNSLVDLSQPRKPESTFSASYSEEHVPPVPITAVENHDNVDIHHVNSLKDSNLQPIEDPEVNNNHSDDGLPTNTL